MKFGTDDATRAPRWPRETSLMLLLVGFALFAASFWTVLSMPDLVWHPARDAELRVTYQTYRDTGALLIKPTGAGSNYTQAPAPGPLSPAAWDDDPGSYVIASLLSHVTDSASPYPGLRFAQAVLVSLPFLWLPIAVARVFRRARAGYALVLLPPLMWVMNGTILTGTENGLSDNVSTLTRVCALYGLAASMVFLSLSLAPLGEHPPVPLGRVTPAHRGFGSWAGSAT